MPKPKVEDSKIEESQKKVPGAKKEFKRHNSKNFSKGKGKDDKSKEIRFNPVEWYTKYKSLADEVTKFGFNHIKGSKYLGALSGASLNPAQIVDEMDTLWISVAYLTTPGITESNSQGFAMQMRRFYLAMKRKYRGLNTYQVGDLSVTIFCIAEFFRYVAKLERIYGTFNYFNVKNRIVPVELGTMLGVDRDNIYQHLADFRSAINALIVKAQTLCLPNGLDVINRWMFLESNIFKDSDDARASYILFDDMNQFYTYQATWSSTGGSAVLSKITAAAGNPSALKYDELIAIGHDILDLLLTDDDITLQLGDIVSYFTSPSGETNLLTLQLLPEDYVVVPSYNADILEQIHNCNTVGRTCPVTDYSSIYSSVTPSNFDVGGNGTLIFREGATGLGDFLFLFQTIGGSPVYNMYLSNSYESANHHWGYSSKKSGAQLSMVFKAGNVILDTWKEVPTSDDVMEMTRLTTAIEYSKLIDGGVTSHQFHVVGCGSEVICDIYYHTTTSYYQQTTTLAWPSIFGSAIYNVASVAKIDWHMRSYLIDNFDTTNEDSNFKFAAVSFGDLDNARVMNYNDLRLIHDAAIMSLFEVSSVDAFKDSFTVK